MMEKLNSFHQTIKFTFNASLSEVTFLDFTLYKGSRFHSTGKLDIKPHFKSTNKFQYLHFCSSHPRSTFRGIIKGELIRILRSSSNQQTFKENSDLLSRTFSKRGYPDHIISEARRQVDFSFREQVLKERPTSQTPNPTPFVIRYSDRFPTSCLKQAITPDDHQDIPRICYTRNRTVGNHIVRARITNPTPRKDVNRIVIRYTPSFRSCSAPCNTPMCACCQMMSRKEVVFSTSDKPFRTIPNTSCNTVGAIYLLECTRCHKKNKYIGQTARTIRERMAGHRTVHQTKNMPIYRHLKKKDHSFKDLKVTVLERAQPEELLNKERDWMDKLETRLPKGLNSIFN